MTVACGALLLSGLAAAAQNLPWQAPGSEGGNPKQLVRFLYPQQVTLPAGKPATIELHFRINEGLHINSHEPRQKSLIRTELKEAEPPGVSVASVDFPAGQDYAFPADPSQKLSVYAGEFVLKMHLTAQHGTHLLAGELRYQACDMNTCFPPRNLPVPVSVIGQ
ncbi:MAG: protein-disulfide reductase DsbD domain-containing protein [Acidobacteriaceae bacterium]